MSRAASTDMDVKADKKPRATNCTWPLFTAISDVMMQAKKGRLEPEDLLSLPATDDVFVQSELLKKSWERTVRQFNRDQAAKKAEELANPEAAAKAAKKKKKKGEEVPSLTRALWPQVRGLWRVAFGLYLVSVGLAFLGPFLLGRTVQLLQTTQQCGLKEQQAAVELQDDGNLVSDDPISISDACRESSQIHLGYIYAAAMLGVKLCEAMLRSWHDHLMTRLALRARAAIIATIYRKCLWLSGMGAGDTTTGRIQNLMANDAQFFLQIAPMFNNLFVAPLQARAAPPRPPPSRPAGPLGPATLALPTACLSPCIEAHALLPRLRRSWCASSGWHGSSGRASSLACSHCSSPCRARRPCSRSTSRPRSSASR